MTVQGVGGGDHHMMSGMNGMEKAKAGGSGQGGGGCGGGGGSEGGKGQKSASGGQGAGGGGGAGQAKKTGDESMLLKLLREIAKSNPELAAKLAKQMGVEGFGQQGSQGGGSQQQAA